MSKIIVFVATYSAVLVGLFIVFSYLMYKVEPEKIFNNVDKVDIMTVGKIIDVIKHIEDKSEKKSENISENQSENKPENEPENKSENPLFALLKRRQKQGHALNVPRRLIVSRKQGNSTFGTINDLESIADLNNTASWEHSAGFRRSADFHKPINYSESIILRVLDDDGYPRIEIKINNKDTERVSKSMQSSSKYKVNLDSVEMNDINNSLSNKSELELLYNSS